MLYDFGFCHSPYMARFSVPITVINDHLIPSTCYGTSATRESQSFSHYFPLKMVPKKSDYLTLPGETKIFHSHGY